MLYGAVYEFFTQTDEDISEVSEVRIQGNSPPSFGSLIKLSYLLGSKMT